MKKKKTRIGRLVFPVNSLFFFSHLSWREFDVVQLSGRGIVTSEAESLKLNDYLRLIEYEGKKLFVDFKAEGMPDSKQPRELLQDIQDIGVPDIKITELAIKVKVETRYSYLDLYFKSKTLHRTLVKKMVDSGKVPNADMERWVEKIKENIVLGYPAKERPAIQELMKSIKGTTLVLDRTVPEDAIKDEALIYGCKKGPMGWFYDEISTTELKGLGHDKKGGVTKT